MLSSEIAATLRNLWKYYDKTPALKDINLMIKRNGFYFLFGPSGAGKTTLLRVMFGDEPPTKGEVVILGNNISRLKKEKIQLLRRRIGYVFQDFKIVPYISVFENVAFPLRIKWASQKEIALRVQKVLMFVGLEGKTSTLAGKLSWGEKQRVAIARAMVSEPEVIFADEPTGNLDPELSLDIVKIFEEMNKKFNTTIVLATHSYDLISAVRKANIIRMEQGKLVEIIPK